jgi:hypothetical protein
MTDLGPHVQLGRRFGPEKGSSRKKARAFMGYSNVKEPGLDGDMRGSLPLC